MVIRAGIDYYDKSQNPELILDEGDLDDTGPVPGLDPESSCPKGKARLVDCEPIISLGSILPQISLGKITTLNPGDSAFVDFRKKLNKWLSSILGKRIRLNDSEQVSIILSSITSCVNWQYTKFFLGRLHHIKHCEYHMAPQLTGE
jgi:hypothetical protein